MESEHWSWIGDWSGRRALLTPKREAIYDYIEGKRYSFEKMDLRANQMARVLFDLGIGKGDRLGVYSKNRFDYFDLFFAAGKIGAILVPFYHLGAKTILRGDFSPSETIKVIEEERCTIVVGVPTMLNMMAEDDGFPTADFTSV